MGSPHPVFGHLLHWEKERKLLHREKERKQQFKVMGMVISK
tara:strand:+ start:330 stop:452 length:123 start_codon:yes stop_codon:yes gene_type:complete